MEKKTRQNNQESIYFEKDHLDATLLPNDRDGILEKAMTPLPNNFVLGDDDVICGRGKKCLSHIGNLRFLELIRTSLPIYTKAKTKLDKSIVIMNVIDDIQKKSPQGGFVKHDPLLDKYYRVSDDAAREKTSQAFRDHLHNMYKSSNESRRKKRRRISRRSSREGLKHKHLPKRFTGMVSCKGCSAKLRCQSQIDSLQTLIELGVQNVFNEVERIRSGRLQSRGNTGVLLNPFGLRKGSSHTFKEQQSKIQLDSILKLEYKKELLQDNIIKVDSHHEKSSPSNWTLQAVRFPDHEHSFPDPDKTSFSHRNECRQQLSRTFNEGDEAEASLLEKLFALIDCDTYADPNPFDPIPIFQDT